MSPSRSTWAFRVPEQPRASRPAAKAVALAALLLAALLAGCTGRGGVEATDPSTTETGLVPVGGQPQGNATEPAPPQPSAATMNLSRDPVDIQESGTLLGGLSKEWTWHVAPGYATFEVRVLLTGPGGAPAFAVHGYELRLTGGDPQNEYAETGGPNIRLGIGGPHCALCHNGVEFENQAGHWRLALSSDPSGADYSVEVVVAY